jgi:hypothetical protein
MASTRTPTLERMVPVARVPQTPCMRSPAIGSGRSSRGMLPLRRSRRSSDAPAHFPEPGGPLLFFLMREPLTAGHPPRGRDFACSIHRAASHSIGVLHACNHSRGAHAHRTRLRTSEKLSVNQPPPALADLLDMADVLPSREVPADIVTMYSQVEIEDPATQQIQKITLCYPGDAQPTAGLHLGAVARGHRPARREGGALGALAHAGRRRRRARGRGAVPAGGQRRLHDLTRRAAWARSSAAFHGSSRPR